jgi:cyclopropane fatty-acyl-phospholipid synthase-like methyltransferase
MNQPTFSGKWTESSLFVEPGAKPITQRQLNLYYYYLFIQKILNRIAARKVLEIGCGRGTMALYLTKYLGFDLTLLDKVPEAIQLAQENFNQFGLKAEFVVGDALATGLPAGSFDAIVSIGLAEHFSPAEVARLLAEQYRLLRPGGVMISLNIPKKFSIQSLNSINKALRFDSKRPDYFRNDLSAEKFAALAENAGFSEVKITHVCPFPIWVPVSPRADRWITSLRRIHLWFRRHLMRYPYQTNFLVAQAHFLVGEKK